MDARQRALEFAMGDEVFLKVSQTIVRFGTKEKFSQRYIGLVVIIARVGA